MDVRNEGYSLESHDTAFSWMQSQAAARISLVSSGLNVHIGIEVCLTLHSCKRQFQKFSRAQPQSPRELEGHTPSQTHTLQLHTQLPPALGGRPCMIRSLLCPVVYFLTISVLWMFSNCQIEVLVIRSYSDYLL